MKKVKLKSDFNDYYDHWFDVYNVGLTFERMSTGGMSRRGMLEYMQSIGIRVPIFGITQEILYSQNKQPSVVVVYMDEFSHRGEGKVRLTLAEAASEYPDKLVIEYIPSYTDMGSKSLRYLQVGDKRFWLEYSSTNDWRSNCGDVSIRILSREPDGYHKKIGLPLFAIDFVEDVKGILYAVDFNIAPGIKGTGVENILSAMVVAESIKLVISEGDKCNDGVSRRGCKTYG